ncbi:MAG: outer membrane beta-barrel protein [Rhizomicrobium sp.]
MSAPAAAQTATPTLPNVTAAPTPTGSTASEASTYTLAPKGFPLGVWRLFPTLETLGNYDDNVFLSEKDRQADYFFRETPQFLLRSDWSRHEADLYGAASFYQYTSLNHQDHLDWDAGGDARLDILRGITLSGNGSYSVEHDANSSPDQPTDALSPDQFAVTQSNVTFSYNPYRFGLTLGGSLERYDYDPSLLVNGATSSNSDRNEVLYDSFVKTSFQIFSGYSFFLQGTENSEHYDLAVDRSGLRRDNDGYGGDAGFDLLITNLIRGEIFGGYLKQQFKAPFHDESGLTYGANLDWFPTPLWTFHLTASRALNGTVLATASTEDDRTVQVKADFRARSDVVITGAETFLDSKFDGSPRDDLYTTSQLMLAYYLNHWASVELSDTFQIRGSTVSGENFDDNVAMIGLRLQE